MIKRVALSILLLMSFSSWAENWQVMGRHGECHNLEKFAKKTEILSGAETPNEVSDKLNELNIEHSIVPYSQTYQDVLKLIVPSKSWYLVLVKRNHCRKK